MPSSVHMLDLLKTKGKDGVLNLIDAVGLAAPEVGALHTETVAGIDYDVTLITEYPRPAFRRLNSGVSAAKARWGTRKAQCMILDERIEIDKAAEAKHAKGASYLQALLAGASLSGTLLTMGTQTIYGTTGADALGFPGLNQMVAADMTVDATGTSANAGTSVYIVMSNPMGVHYILGEDGKFDLQPFYDGEGEDANGKKFPASISYLNCRPGLSNNSPFSVARIKNITAQAGKGLTDTLISQALEKFPTMIQPTHILMNRIARGMLQRSRTVVLNGGGGKKVDGGEGNIAPIPTEAFGIPIVCTDSIVSTEAIA